MFALFFRANPMGTRANPMGTRANPMGTRENQMGTRANPMGTTSSTGEADLRCPNFFSVMNSIFVRGKFLCTVYLTDECRLS